MITCIMMGELADHFLWHVIPRAFGIATQKVGAVLLLLWLGSKGYERFLKPGHDDLGFVNLRIRDRE